MDVSPLALRVQAMGLERARDVLEQTGPQAAQQPAAVILTLSTAAQQLLATPRA